MSILKSLVFLWLVTLFAGSRSAAQPASQDLGALRLGQVVVWISTTPGNNPGDFSRSFLRFFPNVKLVVLRVPRENFASEVERPQAVAPDVALIDNRQDVGTLLQTKRVWLAWGMPRLANRGLWVIFKDTQHLAQAQAFIRWIADPAVRPRVEADSIPEETARLAREEAVSAMRAIVDGDQAGLEALLDAEAARSSPGLQLQDPGIPFRLPADHAQMSNIQPIRISGNSQIALVLMSAIASGEDLYDLRRTLFVFRNQGGEWRILYIGPNEGMRATESSLLNAFESRVTGDQAEAPPPPAVLLSPPDRAVLPRFPLLPELSWRSDAADTASFIVEWQYRQPRTEREWSISKLAFAPALGAAQPFKERAPFGIGAQPHRWRVWTLGRSGAISVSPWRTVLYSN